MRGLLNGRRFDTDDMMAVADDEWLPVGRSSVWTFTNDGRGMAMAHPIHIHGVRFRITERSGADIPADLRDGVLRVGYKDTFASSPASGCACRWRRRFRAFSCITATTWSTRTAA
jgi:FtsP/CotA-like multicopper oxidase with cupredoxin domain